MFNFGFIGIDMFEYIVVFSIGYKVVFKVVIDVFNCGVLMECWFDIFGLELFKLISYKDFFDMFGDIIIVFSFEVLENVFDSYGVCMWVFLILLEIGDYMFWIVFDDYGVLLLSSDYMLENVVEIVYVEGWINNK